MTTSDTTPPPEAVSTTVNEPSRARRLRRSGQLVDRRLGGPQGLQARYLRNESRARADVARLRQGAGRAPGELPEIWDLTQVDVPDSAGDAPTWEEVAVHTAMTLYAIHQQARNDGMFRPGASLGRAARELVGRDEENPSARARFNALVTSTTVDELRHHLKSFVSQLRSRAIPLDHAMLADEITRFQSPGGAKAVRLAWARQYSNLPTTSDASASAETLSTTSTTSGTEN